jgi:hypothetical protein
MLRPVAILAGLAAVGRLFAADYYVAPGGVDTPAGGTFAAPFATIQFGVDRLAPGDTLHVRGGIYRESVTFPASGTAGGPITVKAFPGETATVSGADLFSGSWGIHTNSIYKAAIGGQIRQLFINGKNTNEARWPNADPENLVNMPRGLLDDGSTTNVLVDSALPDGDFTGAIVHINPGSQYISYTRRVAAYTPGVQLTVDTPLRPDTHYTPKKDNPYWLFGVYDALDTENEWFVDTGSGEIFLWAPGGADPDTLTVEIKARDIAFDLSNRSHIELDGLEIFAAGVRMENSQFCTVRNCRQDYVEHYREIRNHAWNTFSDHSEENYFSGSNNSWINCEIFHSASHGIYDYNSVSNTVRNCRISQVNYMAHRAGCVWSRNTEHSLIERNTFEFSGKYAFFFREAKWAKVRFNIMRYGGLLSGYDGGLSYGQNEGNGIEHAYNWVHFYGWAAREAWGSGIYWDDTSWGSLAHHNVVWNMYDGNFRLNNREEDADPGVLHLPPERTTTASMPLRTSSKARSFTTTSAWVRPISCRPRPPAMNRIPPPHSMPPTISRCR